MLQNIIVLSLLITIVIVLRLVFRKKVPSRLIYALWLAVIIKLCIPVSLFHVLPQMDTVVGAGADSAVVALENETPTVSERTPEQSDVAEYRPEYETKIPDERATDAPVMPDLTQEKTDLPALQNETFGDEPFGEGIPDGERFGAEPIPQEQTAFDESPDGQFDAEVTEEQSLAEETGSDPIVAEQPDDTEPVAVTPIEPEPTPVRTVNVMRVIRIAWAALSAAVALFFLVNVTVFSVRLRRTRTFVGRMNHVKVYCTSVTATPCVWGIIPTVYITPEVKDSPAYSLALSHEWTHICHGDNIWAIVRILALIAYPWNPLVWAAAILSKRDSEFACDEAVTAKMSRGERLDYARMLLDSVTAKPRGVVGLGSAPLKERIKALTENRKNRVIIAVAAIILAVAVIFCSFLGFRKDEPTHEYDGEQTADDGDTDGEITETNVGDEDGDDESIAAEDAEEITNTDYYYISITGSFNDEDSVASEVYAVYDLADNSTEKLLTLPSTSAYPQGVCDLGKGTVYYSAAEELDMGERVVMLDNVYAYDMKTGETTQLTDSGYFMNMLIPVGDKLYFAGGKLSGEGRDFGYIDLSDNTVHYPECYADVDTIFVRDLKYSYGDEAFYLTWYSAKEQNRLNAEHRGEDDPERHLAERHLDRYDARSGQAETIEASSDLQQYISVSQDGKRILTFDLGKDSFVMRDNGQTYEVGYTGSLLNVMSPDGQSLYYISLADGDGAEDKTILNKYDLSTQTAEEIARFDFYVSNMVLLRKSPSEIQKLKDGKDASAEPVPFLELDDFMDTFVRYFHDDYSSGKMLYGNALYAMSLLGINAANSEEGTFDIVEKTDEHYIEIKESDLKYVTEMILGKEVELPKYHYSLGVKPEDIDPRFNVLTDEYLSDEKVYRFVTGRDFWHDDPCVIDHSTVQIRETDGKIIYTATVNRYEDLFSDVITETKRLTYIFSKNVSDGIMYYKLVGIVDRGAPDEERTETAPMPERDVEEYALFLALFFKEVAGDATSLRNDAELYDFLSYAVYDLYENNVIELENISEKDYYPIYLIPNDVMEKAASLLLGVDTLPEMLYSDDFDYMRSENAFRFTPYGSPMYYTEIKDLAETEGGYDVTVEISDLDRRVLKELIYSFRTVYDDEWGEGYRLISIGRVEGKPEITGTLTVTSLDELKKLTYDGYFGSCCDFYDYFYHFFVEGWEFPEVNDVVFSDISFTFELPFNSAKGIEYSFKVVKSDLEGLKPGKYRRRITYGMNSYWSVTDPDDLQGSSQNGYTKYSEYEEVFKLRSFIFASGIWNTPTYARGTTYPGAYDYIYSVYGTGSRNELDYGYGSLSKYAREEFGITKPENMYLLGDFYPEAGFMPRYERFPREEYDITDVRKTADGTEITVQTYADLEHFVYSHEILYYFDKDRHFNGYKILKEGKYEPRGLRYIEDDGTIEVKSLNNLRYYTDRGIFSREQYDFYYNLLCSDGEYQKDYPFCAFYTIRFSPMKDEASFESTADLNVYESKIPELPIGKYQRKLTGGQMSDFVETEKTDDSNVGNTDTAVARSNLDGFSYDPSARTVRFGEDSKTVRLNDDAVLLVVNGSVAPLDSVYTDKRGHYHIKVSAMEDLGVTTYLTPDSNGYILYDDYVSVYNPDRKCIYSYGYNNCWIADAEYSRNTIISGLMTININDFRIIRREDAVEEIAPYARLTALLGSEYEKKYGEKFEYLFEIPEKYDYQTYERYLISDLSSGALIGRFTVYRYGWKYYYVDNYSDDIFVMNDGAEKTFERVYPTSDKT